MIEETPKKKGTDGGQLTFPGLPEVRPDGSENLDQNGKKRRKRGPAKTTPEERRLMHANQGNTGVASSEDWERRRDINND